MVKKMNTITVELTSYGSLNVVTAPVRLHMDSYNCVRLACLAPKTITTAGTNLCKVTAYTIDESGQKVLNSLAYNLPYIGEIVGEKGWTYLRFESMFPREFCKALGELMLTFTYYEVDANSSATTVITSGTFNTVIAGNGDNISGVKIAEYDATATAVNECTNRLNTAVVQLANSSVNLPANMLPYHVNGGKRIGVEYKAEYTVTAVTGEVVTSSGVVRAIALAEHDNLEPFPDTLKAYQTEYFECEYGFFIRRITFNYSASHSYGESEYPVPNFEPSNKAFWQAQIDKLVGAYDEYEPRLNVIEEATKSHGKKIADNASALTKLTEKENNRNHFKGLFPTPNLLPTYSETDPKGATDNDYANVISTGTIWSVDTVTHAWKDSLAVYPSDTTILDFTREPEMNGVAQSGVSAKASPCDHTHPTDTTRASVAELNALEHRTGVAEKSIINMDKTLVSHGESITALVSRANAIDNKVVEIASKDLAQDNRLTALDNSVVTINASLSSHGMDITKLGARADSVDSEITAIKQKDISQDGAINTLTAEKLAKADINKAFQEKSLDTSYTVTDTGALVESQVSYNPSDKITTTKNINVVPVTDTKARLFLVQEQSSLRKLEAWKEAVEGDTRNYPADLSGVPTGVPTSDISVQSFLTGAYSLVSGKPAPPLDQTQLLDDTAGIVYRYYTFNSKWALSKGSPATIATQESVGVGKGSMQKYYNFYEVDGTSTPNGLDDLDNKVNNNLLAITAEVTRAKASEALNANNISSEATTRANEVTALSAKQSAIENALPLKADKSVTVAGKSLAGNVSLDKLTLQKNGVELGVYDGNGAKTINILSPVKTSDLTNNGDGTNVYATVNQLPNNYISTSGGQTINGVLSVASPTTAQNVATKGYVDNLTVSVVDNLTSTSATSALSANQGRALKAEVDTKASSATVNTQLATKANTTNPQFTANGYTITSTEIGYLDRLTSNIQDQLNSKPTNSNDGSYFRMANGSTLYENDALKAMGSLSQYNGNGGVDLPSGVLLIFGNAQKGSDGRIAFPFAFPRACFQVVCQPQVDSTGALAAYRYLARDFSRTGFKAANGNDNDYYRYFAIGN